MSLPETEKSSGSDTVKISLLDRCIRTDEARSPDFPKYIPGKFVCQAAG